MNIDYNKEDLDTYINIQKLTYKTIGELYGVSGNAIKKAAKRLGVSIPVRMVTKLFFYFYFIYKNKVVYLQ